MKPPPASLQVLVRGRGNWRPYGRPQKPRGLLAVSGFPPDSELLLLAAVPPALLPVRTPSHYSKYTANKATEKCGSVLIWI